MHVVSDQQAESEARTSGVRFVRRIVNETTYDMAVRQGADRDLPLEFMCECGRVECSDQIVLLLRQFDRSSPAGSFVAHPAA
jgi:hypothetical protein